MAQSISFGAYTIHIDGGKLSVLDQNGQVIATADLTTDAAAKIALPNGQVLDMARLADALSSDHLADFATAAGDAGVAGGAAGSGMFFHGGQVHGLGGFSEMHVIEASPETPGSLLSTENQQPSPTAFFALRRAPAGETIPAPPSNQLPADHTPHHKLRDDNQPANSHASDNAGSNNASGDNPPASSHASDNAGGNNPSGDNPPANSHASDNAGGNNASGNNPPAIETPVDSAPIAVDEVMSLKEDTTLHGAVIASDVDGDHLVYGLVDGPQHGTVSFDSNGTYTYTPNDDYNGSDSFTFKANDGSLDSNTGIVNLTVTPVDDAPVASDAAATTPEDTALKGHVTATDVDGDHLTYSLVSGPQHGTISLNSDGTYTYTPNADYNGADSFTYKASDGSLESHAGIANLTVTPVNDAPVITADNTALHYYETSAGTGPRSQTFSAQPHVQITDIDSAHMSTATLDTHGFQHGDTLHIGTSPLFDVTVTQTGDDYHVSISAKSGSESTADFQNLLNSVSFDSTGSQDGMRVLDYAVTDDQHAVSNTAHGTINIQSSYEVWVSQLAPNQKATGSGDDILHLDAKLTGKFDMGAGDDTVHYEINNGTLNHQMASNLQNAEHIDTTGHGNNTVSLSINDVLNMTDGDHFLTIIGDKSDTVNLTGDNSSHQWQQAGSHDGFNVYTWSDPNHAAVVEISQIMHQTAG
ncbi:MAG TPA: Ig-like domain-containing protein [Terriglobia bacterium]|nr:Ig-like domain-containing protein [Terriglobia bacterium]